MRFTELATPIDCLGITSSGEMVTWSMNSVPVIFNNQLDSSLMEVSEDLPSKCPDPYVTDYRFNSTNKQRTDLLEPTYHRVGSLMACACWNVGFISSNPGVRTMKNRLSGP